MDKRIISGRKDATGGAVIARGYATKAEQTAYLVDLVRNMDERTRKESAIIYRTNRQVRQLRQALQHAGILRATDATQENPWIPRVRALYAGYMEFGRQVVADRIERDTYLRIRNVPERYLLQESMPEAVMTRQAFCSVYGADSPAGRAMTQMATLAADLCDLPPSHRVRFLRRVIGIEEALYTRANRDPRQMEAIRAALAALEADPTEVPAAPVLQAKEGTGRSAGGAAPEEIGITILTMHASKGLEYANVYLPDLNEGILPPRRSRTDAAVEEERRLFYVAMTRAKEHLELLYVKGTAESPCMPTRFLLPLGIGPEYHD